MPTFAVRYRYQEGSDAARTEHRPVHVDFLRRLHSDGALYMSGPLAAEPAQALLVFEAADEGALATLLDADPFAVQGLIAERDITQWNVFFDPRTAAGA